MADTLDPAVRYQTARRFGIDMVCASSTLTLGVDDVLSPVRFVLGMARVERLIHAMRDPGKPEAYLSALRAHGTRLIDWCDASTSLLAGLGLPWDTRVLIEALTAWRAEVVAWMDTLHVPEDAQEGWPALGFLLEEPDRGAL